MLVQNKVRENVMNTPLLTGEPGSEDKGGPGPTGRVNRAENRHSCGPKTGPERRAPHL